MEFSEFVSIAAASPETAKQLVRADQGLLVLKNGSGETPLHYLAIENEILSVRALVDVGADVNTQDLHGSTPMMHAINLGYDELLDYLLMIGARIDLKTLDGDTALTEAVLKDRMDVIRKMLKFIRSDINDYFGPVYASEIASEPTTDSRRLMCELGLKDPYEISDPDA